MKAASKIYNYIRAVPKTLFFNFWYLPIKVAIKLPIIVSHRTRFMKLGGRILIEPNSKFGKIKLGFGNIEVIDSRRSRLLWNVERKAQIKFGHNVKIGVGSKLHIKGIFAVGDKVNFTGDTVIICKKRMSFGSNVLVSWRTLFTDTDFHPILDESKNRLNHDRDITVGNNVWICLGTTVLKGSRIGDNSIVSASSHIFGSFPDGSIIGGNPAKTVGSMENKSFVD